MSLFKKYNSSFVVTCLIILLLSKPIQFFSQTPTNLDFESGAAGANVAVPGWTFSGRTSSAYTDPFWGTSYPAIPVQYAIETVGTDPIGGFPKNSPFGGTKTLRVGGTICESYNPNSDCYGNPGPDHCDGTGYNIWATAKQTFTVDPNNPILQANYALVHQLGSHGNDGGGYVRIKVIAGNPSCGIRTVSGTNGESQGTINTRNVCEYPAAINACYSVLYGDDGSPNAPSNGGTPNCCSDNLAVGAPARYLGWTTKYFDLSPYANSQVTLVIETCRCPNAVLHWAYGYFDFQLLPVLPGTTSQSGTLCGGGNVTLTGPVLSGVTYNWSGPGLASANGTNTMSVNAGGTYTLTYSAGGCFNKTATFTVAPGTGPAINLSANSSSMCTGQSVVLTPGGASTYTLNSGVQTFTSSGTSFTVTPSTNTTYTLTGTDAGGCAASNSPTCQINVTQTPTVSIASVSSNTICAGQNAVITPSGASTYTLLPGNVTGASFTVSPNATSIYTISGTSTSCISSASTNPTATITVSPTPTVSISVSSPSVCSGSSATLTANGASTYSWSTSASIQSITVSPNTTTSYTVIGTTGSCTNSAVAGVSVTATPTVSINASSASICSGSSATLTASGATTYSWSTGNNTQTISVNPNSSTTYTVVGFNGNCTNVATTAIGIFPTPTVSIVSVSNNSICLGQSSVITLGGAGTYTLNLGNIPGTSFTVSPSTTTTYTISGTSAQGCVSNANTDPTTTITVNPTPTVSISASGPGICSGSSVTFTANGATTYSWSTGNNTQTITVIPNTTSSYTVIGTSGICSDTAVATVSVTVTPTVSISASSPSVCSGSSATLTASGATTYSWSTGAVTNSVSVNPGSLTTYTLIGLNGNCADTVTTTIAVNPTPTVSIISVSKDSICPGQSTVIIPGGASTYTLMPGGTTGTGFTVSPISTTSYTISGTSAQGCTASASTDPTTTITVNPGALASFTAAPTAGFSPLNVSFTNTSLGTGNTYTWNMGNSNTTYTTQNAAYTYTNMGTYTVTLTADNGLCPATTYTLLILVEQVATIIIPNVFTPNGDGVNDGFFITTTAIKDLEADIFDRWGIKVWQMRGLHAAWDGYGLNGNKMTDGTYFYILRATDVYGKSYDKTGNILLIR